MKFEWYLKHPDGTKCMPFITSHELHAWSHANNVLTNSFDGRVHPAQLVYFEVDQELCLGVKLDTGFEYWVRRVA